MAQQTAIEWLYNMMLKPLSQWPDDLWQQAKQMEKDQIINAAADHCYPTCEIARIDAEQYYNETYGKQ
jgi:hypothetical protein